MHVQQRTGIPTVNGLSGHFPKDNWPYTKPSGIGAYQWIERSKPEKNHRVREIPTNINRCIITIGQNNSPNIRKINAKTIASLTKNSPTDIIFTNKTASIGRYKNDLIYVKINPQKKNTNWVLLVRDGKPIPPSRGEYKLTDAKLKNNVLYLTDSNKTKGIQYIWAIDHSTGAFISQEMKEIIR